MADEQTPALRARVLERAAQLLAGGAAMSAKEIAAALTKAGLTGVEKSLVNSVLSREGKGRFSCDRTSYTYTLGGNGVAVAPASSAPRERGNAEPPPERAAVLAAARSLLGDGKPRTAREIASELQKRGLGEVDKSLVNSVLSREGKELISYDRSNFTYRAGRLEAGERDQR
jgi:hypothetical protein